MTAPDDEVVDRGLQLERTALSWNRTALALIVVGSLLLRAGGRPLVAPRNLPGLVVVAGGAALLASGSRRYRLRSEALRRGRAPRTPWRLHITAALTLLLSVAALALALLGR